MNEKGLVVLEQYELDVRNARRGRGSFLVDTDRGLKLLTEYSGTEGRLEFQAEVMGELREKGLERLDFPVRNKEGGFLVKDREEITYLLREWHEGRECEVRNLSEVEEAVRTLAYLHRNFRTAPKEGRENFREESLEEELTRKNAELKRVRKFMRSRRRKTEFEQEFLNHFEGFYGEAEAALEAARSRGLRVLYEKSLAEGWLCHGDYNQHHVLLSREGTAITDFGRCHFGVQTGDLAHFSGRFWRSRTGIRSTETRCSGSTDGCARFQGRSRRIFGYGFPIRRNSGSWPITITAAGKAGFPRKMSKN